MKRRSETNQEIARERMEILFKLAREVFSQDQSLAKRYIEIARKIGMKCGVRLPRQYKQFVCKDCGSLLVPGVNCRVRIRSKGGTRVVVTCLVCGFPKRFPASREKRARRTSANSDAKKAVA